MSSFQQYKLYLVEHLHLAKDALHIYVGLAVFLGACVLFRWNARQWKPWLLVLLVALVGEALDIRDRIGAFQRVVTWENLKDIINTVAIPTVLLLTARYTDFFTRGPQASVAVPQDSGDEAQVPGTALGGERDVL